MNILETAINVIRQERESLNLLLDNIPQDFTKTVELLLSMKGRLIVSGIGKSGYIANKIAASVASTGTHASYIHPAEASHGDLGMISQDDVVMLLSASGDTKELCDIINYCKRFHIPLIGMTMKPLSILAQNADFLLKIPEVQEASSIAAPTSSAVLMLALGDALMVSLYEAKGFSKDDFKLLHPGGKIGANLLKIRDLMHVGETIPQVTEDAIMSDVLIIMSQKGFGTTAVTDNNGKLLGIITDGDLRRHMESNLINQLAKNVMSINPQRVEPKLLAIEALTIMNEKKITSLLVEENEKLCGIIHIHDLIRGGVG